jgi:hypothetical protein
VLAAATEPNWPTLSNPLAPAMSTPPPRCSAAVVGRLFRRRHHASPLPLAYGATPQSPLPIPLHRDTTLLMPVRPRLTLAVGFGCRRCSGTAAP